jgi:hypothetical protein
MTGSSSTTPRSMQRRTFLASHSPTGGRTPRPSKREDVDPTQKRLQFWSR